MKKYLLLFFLLFTNNEIIALEKEKIIQNLENIKNLSFNFEQNINDEKEKGKCILEYPKKIFCKYNLDNQKTLTSNGRYVVIKTIDSHYIYKIQKTPLNLILDKNFIINKIQKAEGKILNFVDEKEINENTKNQGDKDELYETAVDLIKSEGKASTSFLQRKLQIGYNRAARIIDMMEAEGLVSKANHVGKRDVL